MANAPRRTPAPPPPADQVLAHREHRYWRLLRGHDVLGHVGHLDEIHTLTGTTLVETGGHGAALAPGTLPPELHAEITAARREGDALTSALDQARRRWRHLALALRREGLTTTQTAKALGISRAAVDKLVTRATTETAGSTTPTANPTALAVSRQHHQELHQAQDVEGQIETVRSEVQQATARQDEFSARWRRLAVSLQDAGLTNRDVAHLLGVKEPRVTQLAPRDGRRTAPGPSTPPS